ncbi:MAG: hypothetical protein Q6361_00365 [Candidatus Hermodarchaeota archaeon]|nr:hypothetical protein [Candidatus Hermodarchaeota archaeon]
MAKIACPLCNKAGITMVVIGLALVITSAVLTLPWLAIVGLIILLAAYIVPNMFSGDSCHVPNRRPSATNSGEELHD